MFKAAKFKMELMSCHIDVHITPKEYQKIVAQ